MSCWEYEITNCEHDELMLYMEMKKRDHGVIIKMNEHPQSQGTDITINSLVDYLRYKGNVENIRTWIAKNHPDQYAKFEQLYPDGSEW
ncbi:hypothetical protein [Leucothrix arctica]|nr:hypothetical protein [Leucothrix arctica]